MAAQPAALALDIKAISPCRPPYPCRRGRRSSSSSSRRTRPGEVCDFGRRRPLAARCSRGNTLTAIQVIFVSEKPQAGKYGPWRTRKTYHALPAVRHPGYAKGNTRPSSPPGLERNFAFRPRRVRGASPKENNHEQRSPAAFAGLSGRGPSRLADDKNASADAATAPKTENCIQAATYAGELPCADCAGIETLLTLNRDGLAVLTSHYPDRANPICSSNAAPGA